MTKTSKKSHARSSARHVNDVQAHPGQKSNSAQMTKTGRPMSSCLVHASGQDADKRVRAILQAFRDRVASTLGDDLGGRPGFLESLAIQSQWNNVMAASGIASLLLGKDYEMSRTFLHHYLVGKGSPLLYRPPPAVCNEIAKRFPSPGHHNNVNSYDWGIPDIRNGLGHFNLDVVDHGDRMLYFVTDRYKFPARDEKGKSIRHGFQVGKLSDRVVAELGRKLSLLGEHEREGGAKERFELARTEKTGEYTLYVPQRLLADHGVDFESIGIFETPISNEVCDTK